ncbi:MAG: acyl-[acyl-carrier-protein]--UDP-N-acetylglucosamine O-acyltransferase [Elusimicrobia bacterium RIFCSPHIGHO2_02_FULL_57_9]|nr:MAG: acyl-[acyl-carrier-protein]--UDP-N-acetylglucosamine O-acyltransferase [Elusimicrobia bacterium RIFCSPHIGHO2_02_FULL_57_9]
MNHIHPTAVTDPGAKIDPSVKIGPYAVIGPDVVLGAGTTVGAHAVIEYTHMGRDNRIMPGAFVGTPPQDLKYAGEHTILVMGDKNTVRECVTLNRGTAAHGETRIGSGCLFMAYSHVAHDCIIGDGVILVNSVGVAGHVEIGDFSVVGGLVGIHQYVRIGRFCMLGGGSMIGKDIPPFCNCQGDRATLRGLNLLGMRRAGLPRETVQSIKDAYKTLFLSGSRLEEAVAEVKSTAHAKEVLEMLGFIERSRRGIMRPATGAASEEEVTV